MKTIKILFSVMLTSFLLMTASCTTTTTDNSYKMAEAGHTVLTYSALDKDANAVKRAMLMALQGRHWVITNSEYPITAHLNHRGQSAKISVSYSNGNILVETKGSTIDGKKYVPIRYIDFLMKSAYKYLR